MKIEDYDQMLRTIKRICKDIDKCDKCVSRDICYKSPKEWDIDLIAETICKYAEK